MTRAEEIRKYFGYDSRTGVFIWRECPRFPKLVGKTAGCLHKPTGYWFLSLHNKKIKGHIAAWAYWYGEWPRHDIDHKNTNKADNRIANLRPGGKAPNGANRTKQKNNTSGHKGVFWSNASKKWMVQIKAKGKLHYIGLFVSKKLAVAAYASAAREHHGEFARAA